MAVLLLLPEDVADTPPRDEEDRLDRDAAGHLRGAAYAVGERDRHLDDPTAAARDLVGQLDLEAVPVRPGRQVVGGLQRGRPVGAVARGDVVHVHPQHERRVPPAPARQRAPVPRPVRRRATRDVAGADHEVGAVFDLLHEPGQDCGVVREVGVDLDHQLVPALDADREARPVRLAETLLRRPVQHVDLSELLAHLLGELGGAVGAPVVDDEDVCLRQRGPRPTEELLDVDRFVVGGRDDQRPHRTGYAPLSCGRCRRDPRGRPVAQSGRRSDRRTSRDRRANGRPRRARPCGAREHA